jgi:hypothetical protein
MLNPLNHPFLLLVVSFVACWFAGHAGARFRVSQSVTDDNVLEDFKLVLGATLTLLGLIIGFTFSMAVSRYDQRKNLEEQEANAIGTEYVRAALLSPADAAKIQAQLKSYVQQRILFYSTGSEEQLRKINEQTAQLQAQMWSAIIGPASAEPNPVNALVVSGMNDVLNSQGYTQAAWWNRIPTAAWILLITIGIFCNMLMGYVAHGRNSFVLFILPIALAISFFLIADIDSPHWGVIRVHPQNLESLATSLGSH